MDTVFWDVMVFSLMKSNQVFKERNCLLRQGRRLRVLTSQKTVQTFPDLGASYVSDGPTWSNLAQVRNGYKCGNLYMYVGYKKSGENPNFNTLESDRPQHYGLVICVIAQQYPSAIFVFESRNLKKKKSGARFENAVFKKFLALFFKEMFKSEIS